MFIGDQHLASAANHCDIIIFSDERWEKTSQRPFPWRLVHKRRVLFVEPPVCSPLEDKARLQVFSLPNQNVSVACLVCPGTMANGKDLIYSDPETQPIYEQALQDYLHAEGFDQPVVWLCSPAAEAIVSRMEYRLLVYDFPKRDQHGNEVKVQMLNPHSIILR